MLGEGELENLLPSPNNGRGAGGEGKIWQDANPTRLNKLFADSIDWSNLTISIK